MDFFGEIALLRTGKTTATVTAATSVRAVVITRPSFLKLLRDDPRVQLTVLDALVKRMPGDDVFTPS
jgi:CRP-like cAMP-binding protein